LGPAQGRLSLSTDGDKCAMVNFGGNEQKVVFALYSLPIIFSQNFLARSIAFYPQLTNTSMQYVLQTPFISFFGVIIPDCQLQKFTENTHKIAQNCV